MARCWSPLSLLSLCLSLRGLGGGRFKIFICAKNRIHVFWTIFTSAAGFLLASHDKKVTHVTQRFFWRRREDTPVVYIRDNTRVHPSILCTNLCMYMHKLTCTFHLYPMQPIACLSWICSSAAIVTCDSLFWGQYYEPNNRKHLTSWSEHPLINSHIALFLSNCLFIAVLDRSQLTCQFCRFRFFVTPIFH
jgi:hypothetical protein